MTILSCLALAAGVGACGSAKAVSSSTGSSTSAAVAGTSSTVLPLATTSSTAPVAGGACGQMLAASTPAVTAGSTPRLPALERTALQGARTSAFRFTGRTCVATAGSAQVITLDGVASLRPTLVVDGHEAIAGRNLEVRFIGSKIYVYLAEIAARDGGRPWLVADLKELSSASGLDFSQLLDEVRRLSPNGPSPLLAAASSFHPLGRAMIAGQTVYVYRGSFAPEDLSKLGLSANLGKQTAARLRGLGATQEQVTSYVTSDGVARRTIAAIYKGAQLLTVSVNSSARLGRTIGVSPPPASKTIPYSRITG